MVDPAKGGNDCTLRSCQADNCTPHLLATLRSGGVPTELQISHMRAGAQGHLVVIDVSQSVDLDHPQALQFLREDALHINNFFGRCWQLTWVVRCAMWQH